MVCLRYRDVRWDFRHLAVEQSAPGERCEVLARHLVCHGLRRAYDRPYGTTIERVAEQLCAGRYVIAGQAAIEPRQEWEVLEWVDHIADVVQEASESASGVRGPAIAKSLGPLLGVPACFFPDRSHHEPSNCNRHAASRSEAACHLQIEQRIHGLLDVSMIEQVSTTSTVTAAIRKAARLTNNSFSALLDTARVESSLNANARAPTSSARGLFQFTAATWLDVARRHGASAGIDPKMRDSELLALRNDPEISALMAGHLANENRARLTRALGRPVSDEEVYMAHFLGAGGATQLLRMVSAQPQRAAAVAFPRQAASNRSIFYVEGRSRSVAEVADHLVQKLHPGRPHTTRFSEPALAASNADPAPVAGVGHPTVRNAEASPTNDILRAHSLRLTRTLLRPQSEESA